MDYKNKSIPLESVTSFDVNKAIQRSLTKACARHGLGLYICAGEDLPEDEQAATGKKTAQSGTQPAKAASPKQIEILLKAYTGDNLTKLLQVNGITKIEDLPQTKASELITKLYSKKGE